LSKFNEAIKDCSDVLEIAEYLEDGIKLDKNKDACFKAYSRRSMAYNSLDDLDNALKDINLALELINDNNALKLKNEIIEKIKSKELINNIKQMEQYEDLSNNSNNIIDENKLNTMFDNFNIESFNQ